jgi:hypothetical protein
MFGKAFSVLHQAEAVQQTGNFYKLDRTPSFGTGSSFGEVASLSGIHSNENEAHISEK